VTRISFVMPNLNGAKTLDETMRSIQKLKIKPDEIIFSDNLSSDNSLEILKKYEDLNIKIIQPPEQLSMSEHWNFAVKECSSEWYFLLCNDDLVRHNFVIQAQKDLVKIHKNVSVISYRCEVINEKSELVKGKVSLGRSYESSAPDFILNNLKSLNINVAGVLVKKEAWIESGGYPESFQYIHDLVFFQKISMHRSIMFSPKVLGRYRIYNNGRNDAARALKTETDFKLFESTFLIELEKKYVGISRSYFKECRSGNSPRKIKKLIIENIRTLLFYILTHFRRLMEFGKLDGFK
jgi:glycosyltransferase involved in cell wall biosynthesis